MALLVPGHCHHVGSCVWSSGKFFQLNRLVVSSLIETVTGLSGTGRCQEEHRKPACSGPQRHPCHRGSHPSLQDSAGRAACAASTPAPRHSSPLRGQEEAAEQATSCRQRDPRCPGNQHGDGTSPRPNKGLWPSGIPGALEVERLGLAPVSRPPPRTVLLPC